MKTTTPVVPSRLIGRGKERVILVHGWMAGHCLFTPMLKYVDVSRYTYATMDCRGYGLRANAPGPFTIETIASDILAMADGLGWPSFHLVGHSMAGMAAQWLLVKASGRLSSVVLLASVPACGARISAERRALLLASLADAESRRTLINVNTGERLPAQHVDELLKLSLESTHPEPMRQYLPSWSDSDFAALVHGSSVPTAVLVGEHDPGITRSLMENTVLQYLPFASFMQLEGVGHYPMFEAPAAHARLLESLFQSHPTTCQIFNPGY